MGRGVCGVRGAKSEWGDVEGLEFGGGAGKIKDVLKCKVVHPMS